MALFLGLGLFLDEGANPRSRIGNNNLSRDIDVGVSFVKKLALSRAVNPRLLCYPTLGAIPSFCMLAMNSFHA